MVARVAGPGVGLGRAEVDHHLVLRAADDAADPEPQLREQVQHRAVLGQHEREEPLQPFGPRRLGEPFDQPHADAVPVVGVAHDDREFGDAGLGERDVAGGADDLPAPHRDEPPGAGAAEQPLGGGALTGGVEPQANRLR